MEEWPRNRRSGGALIDEISRVLAHPMPRRHAIVVLSGALLAGSGVRPRSARGDARTCPPFFQPSATKKCQGPGGQSVCVPPELPCCSTERCGGACAFSWRTCSGDGTGSAACNDTEAMCTDPTGPGRGVRTTFCHETVHVAAGTCSDGRDEIAGWCCRKGERCGQHQGDCTCAGVTCGDACCKRGEYCESRLLDADTCEKLCPDGSQKCNGVCCTGLETCGFTGCSCKPGLVSCGTGRCCAPRDDPGDPNPSWNPFRNMVNMMGATSAASGGSSSRSLLARPAQTGSTAIHAALDAIAAVSGQAAAAQLAIRAGKRDPAFRRKVTVARITPPTIVAGPGLDAASAAALTRLLAAEANANALVAATATALWRSRGAHAKSQRTYAKSQLRAAAKYAGQAAAALKGVPALRTAAANALTAGAVAEVVPTVAQVTAFQATVRSSGIPSTLRTSMGRLGVGASDLKRLRSGVLDQTVVTASNPVLIAPLKDPTWTRDHNRLVSELSKFAKRARRHPIAR
jgi:hypothetical protein